MVAAVWGAHAPSRAGDDALVIANFFTRTFAWEKVASMSLRKSIAARAPQSAREGACAPQKADGSATLCLISMLHCTSGWTALAVACEGGRLEFARTSNH